MSSVSGTYKDIDSSVANADAGLDAWITALDARLQNLSGGDTATRAHGTVTMNVIAENGAGEEYTHKIATKFDTGVQAAGAPDASVQAIVTALSTYATAVEGQSQYTTVNAVESQASVTIAD